MKRLVIALAMGLVMTTIAYAEEEEEVQFKPYEIRIGLGDKARVVKTQWNPRIWEGGKCIDFYDEKKNAVVVHCGDFTIDIPFD